MRTTAVRTEHPPFRQVLASLGDGAPSTTVVEGAIAAIAGTGAWPQAVRRAIAAGACAVVVDEPGATADSVDDRSVPVILDRRRLRADVCRDAIEARAGEAPRAIVIDCAGAPNEVLELCRDAAGWARVFVGGPLAVRSVSRTSGSTVALLDGVHGAPVTIAITVVAAAARGGCLRVLVLGETRTEVTVDIVAGLTEVETVTTAGSTRSAPRFESSHRLALRRAIDAAAPTSESPGQSPSHSPRPSQSPQDDRPDFAHDVLIAGQIVRGG